MSTTIEKWTKDLTDRQLLSNWRNTSKCIFYFCKVKIRLIDKTTGQVRTDKNIGKLIPLHTAN